MLRASMASCASLGNVESDYTQDPAAGTGASAFPTLGTAEERRELEKFLGRIQIIGPDI